MWCVPRGDVRAQLLHVHVQPGALSLRPQREGTWADSWAPSGLLLGWSLAVRSPGWPRAHRHGIRETQVQLSGKSVFNFLPTSGSHSQVC